MTDPSGNLPRRTVPLRQRRLDWVLLAFFAVNLCFITYFIDIEQLTVPNAFHFQYPAWPPHAIVDLVHSYGRHYDPLLLARPAFWKMTIWIDVLWNGPFYVVAIYAIVRGREWIRVPALVWSGSMSAVVLIILAEEHSGIYRSPYFAMVLLLNLPWLALPAATIARMSRAHPFTRSFASLAPAGAAGPAVDVIACCAGAVTTPGYQQAARRAAPGATTPEHVATVALNALGHGFRVVPGPLNRVSTIALERLAPKRAAIAVFGRASAATLHDPAG